MCSCMAACILDGSQAWARRVQRLEDERRGRGRKEAAPALWRGGGGRRRRKKKNTSAASSHPPRREKGAGTCWGRGTDAAASPAPGQPDLRRRAAGMGRTRPSYLRLRRSPSPSRRFMGASALPTAAASARNDPGMLRRRRRRCVGRANAVPRPPSPPLQQEPAGAPAGIGRWRPDPYGPGINQQEPAGAPAGIGRGRARQGTAARPARPVGFMGACGPPRRPQATAAAGGGGGRGRGGGRAAGRGEAGQQRQAGRRLRRGRSYYTPPASTPPPPPPASTPPPPPPAYIVFATSSFCGRYLSVMLVRPYFENASSSAFRFILRKASSSFFQMPFL